MLKKQFSIYFSIVLLIGFAEGYLFILSLEKKLFPIKSYPSLEYCLLWKKLHAGTSKDIKYNVQFKKYIKLIIHKVLFFIRNLQKISVNFKTFLFPQGNIWKIKIRFLSNLIWQNESSGSDGGFISFTFSSKMWKRDEKAVN